MESVISWDIGVTILMEEAIDKKLPIVKEASGQENPTEKEATDQVLPKMLPFYALRTFLDAEYSAILGFGFYKFSEIVLMMDQMEFGETDLKIPLILVDDVMLCLFYLLAFIILVDDYVRRRIITALAPCRSVRRFSFDVIIGLTYLLCFLTAPGRSGTPILSLGIGLLFCSRWAYKTEGESKEWETKPKAYDHRMKCTVTNWPLFYDRIDFIKHISFFKACCLIFISLAIYKFVDNDRTFSYAVFGLGIFCFIIECFRFTTEKLLIIRRCSDNKYNKYGILTTVGWIPLSLRNILIKFAIKWKKSLDKKNEEG